MVHIDWRKAIGAVLRNQVHRLLGGALRGGHRTVLWTAERRQAHATGIFSTLLPYLGSLRFRTGLEVGPGDNLEVCRLCLAAGCQRMYAVEKYARPTENDERVIFVNSQVEDIELPEAVDFAYSNDVFEHVADVPRSMKAIFDCLRPGGRFVNSIDLRGHNVFNDSRRPLDFLTCPDWLWSLMFSHIVTTNRVRVHEFVNAASSAGFTVLGSEVLAKADASYLEGLRAHLLPRYQRLPDDDLGVLQLLLVLERPS